MGKSKYLIDKISHPVFDYRALRLLVGLIAFLLPFVVSIVSAARLPSISASYYTNARDAFVGMMFVVSAFLWAYNGHTPTEAWTSKVASIAAALIALFPTNCYVCNVDTSSVIHSVTAAVLFSILAFFCFSPFRVKIKGAEGKKGRRNKVYLLCGWVMVACIFVMGVFKLDVLQEAGNHLRITYWGEAIALVAFGFAWIVAGKYIPLFVDKEEELHLFR